MNRYHFESFLNNIPKDELSRTQSFISDRIGLFQPEKYLFNVKVVPEEYHIALFHEDAPDVRVGKKEYASKKGSFLFIEPGTEIMVPQVEKPPAGNFTTLLVKKDLFEQILLEVTDKEHVKHNGKMKRYSWHLIDAIERYKYELLNYGSSHPMMLYSLGIQITYQLLRDMQVKSAQLFKKTGDEAALINKIIEYMHDFHNCNITLNEICSIFYISPSHFQRIFKCQMGVTPYQYLIDIRIKRAKDLLLKNNHSLSEIASLCGFINQAHFSAVFKQRCGVAPLNYKRLTVINLSSERSISNKSGDALESL
ncbi:helix-turn-helix transcriptional regulator [Alkaliphilus peptidifermentans]|uniref:AraC-type DNA-binding protein n=1 Tax=Alkaliphilus peptidifermentans DSM 18978 TaxID=1120976 RepID=A0A1G5IMF6_9FIRM|nr:AraC family transcriptional regulator [Alkaliphilus peptidifermentans]SCY76759.1 AraC-type DNA-binding protein [Alkaliphilus peptidifermentans DSM 18978]